MTRSRRLLWLAALLAAFSPLFAQTATSPASQQAMQKIITQYNQGLIAATKDRDMARLQFIATEAVVTKLFIWIMSWHENGLYIDAQQKTCDFTAFEGSAKKSRVTTNEVWHYSYFDAKSNQTAWPKTEIRYTMQYSLALHHNRWVIEKIDILSEEQKKLP